MSIIFIADPAAVLALVGDGLVTFYNDKIDYFDDLLSLLPIDDSFILPLLLKGRVLK
jgi:hypothetical protein